MDNLEIINNYVFTAYNCFIMQFLKFKVFICKLTDDKKLEI